MMRNFLLIIFIFLSSLQLYSKKIQNTIKKNLNKYKQINPNVKVDNVATASMLFAIDQKTNLVPQKYVWTVAKINQFSLYAFADPDHSKNIQMKNLIDSLQIEQLISGSDNLLEAKCCSYISEIENLEIHTPSGIKNTECFKIDQPYQVWNFCSLELKELKEFRTQIYKFIYNWEGLVYDEPVTPKQDKSDGFSWMFQQSWPQQCQGANQSPININQKDAQIIHTRELDIVFDYKTKGKTSASFKGLEVQLQGDFGRIMFKSMGISKQYYAETIEFKLIGEHQMENKLFDAEVIIKHTCEDGNKLYLSIMIKTQRGVPLNKFFISIDPQAWDKSTTVVLDKPVFINELFLFGEYNKSFYWYKGTETVPPCEGQIDRIVMQQAVIINPEQLQTLKEYLIDRTEPSHSRKIQPLGHRFLYFHEDVSVNCDQNVNDFRSQNVLKGIFKGGTRIEMVKSIVRKTYVNNPEHVLLGEVTPRIHVELVQEKGDDGLLHKIWKGQNIEKAEEAKEEFEQEQKLDAIRKADIERKNLEITKQQEENLKIEAFNEMKAQMNELKNEQIRQKNEKILDKQQEIKDEIHDAKVELGLEEATKRDKLDELKEKVEEKQEQEEEETYGVSEDKMEELGIDEEEKEQLEIIQEAKKANDIKNMSQEEINEKIEEAKQQEKINQEEKDTQCAENKKNKFLMEAALEILE